MNGIHQISRADYDAAPGINFSTMKKMALSPAHYLDAIRNGVADRPALAKGRLTHLAILEPELFERLVVVWTGGRRSSKAWADFQESYPDSEIVTQKESEAIARISYSVTTDKTARTLLESGKAEQSLFWKDSVLQEPCKGRLDFISQNDVIVDLKTTRSAAPDAFGRQCWSLQSHIQAAFYCDGYQAITGRRPQYILIAVENVAPFTTQCYRVPEVILSQGREAYRDMLGRIQECRNAKAWPGYADGILELELPKWAAPFDDAGDLGGLGLVIGGDE